MDPRALGLEETAGTPSTADEKDLTTVALSLPDMPGLVPMIAGIRPVEDLRGLLTQ